MSTDIVIMGANGRMGKTITSLALEDASLALAGLVDRTEHLPSLLPCGCPVGDELAAVLAQTGRAVIIDFTAPEVSLASARVAARLGYPLVVGTTGLNETQREELQALAQQSPIFWSSNMSIGVNVLARILPQLVQALGEDYDIEMVELHHNRKKDSPSGTALTLGECLAAARGWHLPEVRCSARDGIIGERPKAQIGIQAIRGGDVVGVHTVYFMGPGERIEVSHQAHSRENFARGALRAARWLANQQAGKLYGMQDMLQGMQG